jgi:hypothetical protein
VRAVSTTTALQAFSLAFGPLPGVSLPPGSPGVLEDGTGPMHWLLGHWADITAPQRAAAIKLLPQPQTPAQVPTSPKAFGEPRPMMVTDPTYETTGYKAQRTYFCYPQEPQQAEMETAVSASDPRATGRLDGETDGPPTHAYDAGLPVTSAGCASVPGDFLARLPEITKPVAQ